MIKKIFYPQIDGQNNYRIDAYLLEESSQKHLTSIFIRSQEIQNVLDRQMNIWIYRVDSVLKIIKIIETSTSPFLSKCCEHEKK